MKIIITFDVPLAYNQKSITLSTYTFIFENKELSTLCVMKRNFSHSEETFFKPQLNL